MGGGDLLEDKQEIVGRKDILGKVAAGSVAEVLQGMVSPVQAPGREGQVRHEASQKPQ